MQAPRHLRAATRRWWQSIYDQFVLEPHHVALLTAAAEQLDVAEVARKAVASDGAFRVTEGGGIRRHPGIVVERDARMLFARLLRELDLDGEPAPESRPPRIGDR